MNPAATADTPANPASRVLFASLIGTTIEFFDFYIYATAAVIVFPKLFFPQSDPASATLQSFATFALAFIARPVGSALFGHFGDRIGRKATLVAALLSVAMLLVAPGGATALRTLPDPIEQTVNVTTFQAGAGYSRLVGDWQLNATLDYNHGETRTLTDRRADTSSLVTQAAAGTLPIGGALPGISPSIALAIVITRRAPAPCLSAPPAPC